ncbi:ubiquitin carboxyl-terminal hydrolase 22-like [Cimex lectularius]|uniref:Ubiquitin carboxyl-terminal hydrolase n=1 Tax=Cimex lectularius TaxID=79782 RepID=A0A8I6TEG8_CIMLE|nr:ubiquitin carboxyl-terminal hydrolase 22-like [Cimex lectularius]
MNQCEHIKEFKKINGLQTYKSIHSFFLARRKTDQLNYNQVLATCFDCESFNNVCRLLACMHCVYMGCYNKHATLHFTKTAHALTVELSNGNVFCFSCGDYVYDRDIEIIATKHKRSMGINSAIPKSPPWRPSNFENKLLQEHPKRIKLEAHSQIGIRGMINFGSSCYLNCIMQALFHTPILRDYFFTEKHKCLSTKNGECFYCPVSRLFQEYYSEEISSLVIPHEVFYLVWRSDKNLEGNEQKDAHEFFTTAMNLLQKFACPVNSANEGVCNCIVHILFNGKMQSDVVCKSCGNISTKVDPFRDISLDIPDTPASDLFDCLKNFTREEILGVKIECNTCKSYECTTKQLTFQVLPLVIVIHLKRFTQVDKKCHLKNSLYISFPMELNMSPFVSGYRNRRHYSQESSANKKDDIYDNTYTLYAVVEHNGVNLNSGHYFAYIRHTRHTWFKCSDDDVIPIKVEDVMARQGYILFYHKTVLFYN